MSGMRIMFCFVVQVSVWAAAAMAAPAAQSERLFGTLQMTAAHAALCREAGLGVAVVPVSWSRFEPKPGGWDEAYISELTVTRQNLRKLGYKLQVDLGVQYPPGWVFGLPHAQYRNQFGDLFTSRESGKNVPNVVFSAEVRQRLAVYFGQVFARLGCDWDYVRLGCGKYGELNYPQERFEGHTSCYWAFDDLAQGKASGLPEGMPVCPVPGWLPGTASAGHAMAQQFSAWYFDCLKNYQDWQIATVRRWYAGDLCMLYGSWGLRPGRMAEAVSGDLSGLTAGERNGEMQQGADWTRMIGGLRDARVIVYCTWMDGTLGNRDISNDDSPDPARWSPVHWQASLARANPLHLRVWGENTGHNNREAMRITFERIRRFDLMGVMWAFDSELFANPNPAGYATFADFAGFIREYASQDEHQRLP